MENKELVIPDNIEENHNYIFGKKIGKLMANINPKTQFEASMMAMVFMILGGLVTDIYIIFWSGLSLFFRISITINSMFAMLFLYSMLITTFQQYQNYMDVNSIKEIMKNATSIYNSQMKGGGEDGKE